MKICPLFQVSRKIRRENFFIVRLNEVDWPKGGELCAQNTINLQGAEG
jgi:hypothetical protein